MSILSWNVRGLAANSAQHEFLMTLRDKVLAITFPIDIKLSEEQSQ